MSARNSIAELKQRLDIRELWRALGCEGEPGKSCRAPHRPDKKPSFSIFEEGRRFQDFSTHVRGDQLDFIALIRGTDTKGAIAWAREFLGERGGMSPLQSSRADGGDKGSKWPQLRPGTDAEFDALQTCRSIFAGSLKIAAERGFLHFGQMWGAAFWALTDSRRQLVELRRMDGRPWPAFGNLSERKAHCIGTGKAWPLGIEEALAFPKLALVEGAPDFLSCFEIASIENKLDAVGIMAMLGGASRIAPEAAAMLAGREVWLYPHGDDAGRKAAITWGRTLIEAGARVKRFDLSGLVMRDGSAGKDLNDYLMIAPECARSHPKWKEILP